MIQLAGDLANKPGVKSNAQKIQTYLSAVWQEAQDRKEQTNGPIAELNTIQQLILVELVLHQASGNEEPMTLNQIRKRYDLPAWLISKNCLSLDKGYPRGDKFTGGRGYVRSERLGRTNNLYLTAEGAEALSRIYEVVG
jgi:hypothetical protein